MQFIRSLWGTFWILVAAILVTAALSLVLMRTVLPGSGLFHDDLESWVEQEIGIPLEIEDISFSLEGRTLEVSAHHVTLFDPESGEAQISFKNGGIKIDLLSSIGLGEIVTTSLSIERPKISVVHHEDGSLTVDGVGDDGDADRESERVSASSIGWLLSQQSLVIENAEILITEKYFAPMQWHLSDVDLSLVSSGYRHQAVGSMVVGQSSNPININLEWFGDMLNPQGWDGQMHLHGKSVELASFVGGDKNPWGPLVQGRADVEWWGEWLSGQLEKGRATLDRDDAYLELPGLAGGEFFWKKQREQEWQLQMDQLVWGGENKSERINHPASALIERKIDESGRDILTGMVDRVHLVSSPSLSGLYAEFTSGERGVLASGDLQQIKFRSYPDGSDLMHGIELRMDLHQFSVNGLKGMLGRAVSGINGQLQFNEREGLFSPVAGKLLMELDGIYADPLELDLHRGNVLWKQYPAGLLLSSDMLDVTFGELHASGQAQLLLPAEGTSPLLDLQARVKAEKVSKLMEQLPEPIMNKRLVRWLKRGLRSGELIDGTVVLKGPLDRFPYDQGGGQFKSTLQINELDLNYTKGWPAVTNGTALLKFNNKSLQVAIDGGEIAALPVNKLVMTTEQLGKSPLKIYGQIVSNSRELLHTLENTPLSRKARIINSMAALEGDAILNLDIEVPIGQNKPLQVDGWVELHSNKLMVAEMDISVDKLHGNIEFDNEGISIEQGRGEFLGAPLLITAFTYGDEAQSELVINIDGGVGDGYLKQWLGDSEIITISPPNKEVDSGTPNDWSGRIKIGLSEDSAGSEERSINIHLHSDLKNMALHLPAPLDKQSDESWPTTVSMEFSNGNLHRMSLLSPEHIKTNLTRAVGGNEWSGTILVGDIESGDLAADGQEGISIQGTVKRFDLGEWARWQKEFTKRAENNTKSDLANWRLRRVAIDSERADLFGQKLDHLALMATPHKDGYWGIGLSSDQLQGKIKIPADGDGVMIVTLDHAWLGSDEEIDQEGQGGEILAETVEFDPVQIPSMSVLVQDTKINGIALGELQMQTRKTDNGLFFDDVTLKSGAMRVSAQGGWLKRSGSSLSRFNIHATGNELGRMLALFGYQGDIDKGRTSVQIKSEWPGNPTDFSLGLMDGSMEIGVDTGHLRDVENSVGRVFGLLGIHTLTRRLALDFSDITDKGMPFDSIHGTFMVKNGHAHTSDMKIDGPTSTIKITGRTGIVARDYDQIVSVSPKVSETLPATGAMVGGPAGAAVGGAVLLYQKLFKKDGLITTRYTLTGSWDDPQLEPIKKKKAIPPVSEPVFP